MCLSRSPTEGWELEYRMLGRADKGKSPFFQALQKATAANRRPLSSPSPSLSSSAAHHITRGLGTPFRQTDEKFFAVASTWLGGELCYPSPKRKQSRPVMMAVMMVMVVMMINLSQQPLQLRGAASSSPFYAK